MDLAWYSPDLFVAPATRGFVWQWNGWMDLKSVPFQPFIQAQIKDNIKAPRHWPLCGEFTGSRWIPRTNGQ